MESANLDKQHAEGEANLAKERPENATREVKRLEFMLAAVSNERDILKKDCAMVTKQEPTNGDDRSLKNVMSGLSGMEEITRELESTIDQQQQQQQQSL
uniref:Pco088261 n=1 Tax=Arundo donax TaxID=35708 RepID=A0A0A9HUG2_ARUDO